MTFWILLMVCINGAQGCTYDAPPTLTLDYRGSFVKYADCNRAAQAINETYSDSDLYGQCFEVGPPAETEGKQP